MSVYLDHNATAPLRPEALAAMREALARPAANPGSAHRPGREARRIVDAARRDVAALVGAAADEVVFTASGTEACQLAVSGTLGAADTNRRRLLVPTIEHSAVLEGVASWSAAGWTVERIPVGPSGRIDAGDYSWRLAPDVALAVCMAANNETGVCQPIAEIGAACRAAGVPVFVDATQAAGRLPLDWSALPIDLLALSAHKLGGPQGVGALIVRRGFELLPTIPGGGQEGGRRGGTENVIGLAGFGAAARAARAALESEGARTLEVRRRLDAAVAERVPGALRVGDPRHALPNTSLFLVPHDDEELLILDLDRRGFAVSAGAACSAGAHVRSHVLGAMGMSASGRAAVRVSLGPESGPAEVDAFVAALAEAVAAAQLVTAQLVTARLMTARETGS